MGKHRYLAVTITFAIVLMLILPCSAVIANNSPKNLGEQKNLTINAKNINGKNYSIQIEISEEKYAELKTSLDDFLNLANATMQENSPNGKAISYSEWKDIRNRINLLIDSIKTVVGDDFPEEPVKAFINSVIETLEGSWSMMFQPLISVGIGITWIPHYDYETFLGKMLRPIFMRHLIGFSATCRFNPFMLGFPYWHYGRERVWTFLFKGLCINFGDLGINRLIGPQLLLGFGCFTGIIQ